MDILKLKGDQWRAGRSLRPPQAGKRRSPRTFDCLMCSLTIHSAFSLEEEEEEERLLSVTDNTRQSRTGRLPCTRCLSRNVQGARPVGRHTHLGNQERAKRARDLATRI